MNAKQVAKLRKIICRSGYYKKRFEHFDWLGNIWLKAFNVTESEHALLLVHRYFYKAYWYLNKIK